MEENTQKQTEIIDKDNTIDKYKQTMIIDRNNTER